MRKILIWGCAESYNKLCPVLKGHDLEIQALISKNEERFILDTYDVIKPERIPEYDYEYIIVASVAFEEIRKSVEKSDFLKENGCTVDKLIPFWVFFNPGFEFEQYILFKESHPSFLSNFCLGGHLYRAWGLPFLSPTINMYALGENYLDFLRNYKHYMEKPMQRYEAEYYIEETIGREGFTPKGSIDDKIIWYLNHDVVPEDAIRKWNERRNRVNFDNIYAFMTIYTDEQAYAFEALNIEKKLGFYHKDLGLKSVVYLREWEDLRIRNEYQYSFSLMVNALPYQSKMCNIDWLAFFMGKENYLRKKYLE